MSDRGERSERGEQAEKEHDALLRRLGEIARTQDEEVEADPRFAALMQPLGEDERARIAERIAPRDAKASRNTEAPRDAKVVPIRKNTRWVAASVVVFAAAAAFAVYVTRPEPKQASPHYAMVVSGGDKELRGKDDAAPTEVRVLSPDSRLEVVLRPETASTMPVIAVAFVVRDGAAKKANVAPEVSGDGAVRFAATASALFPGETGERGVLLLVAPASTSSISSIDDATAAAAFRGDAVLPNGVSAYRVLVRLVP
jgi:hypothetical protein